MTRRRVVGVLRSDGSGRRRGGPLLGAAAVAQRVDRTPATSAHGRIAHPCPAGCSESSRTRRPLVDGPHGSALGSREVSPPVAASACPPPRPASGPRRRMVHATSPTRITRSVEERSTTASDTRRILEGVAVTSTVHAPRSPRVPASIGGIRHVGLEAVARVHRIVPAVIPPITHLSMILVEMSGVHGLAGPSSAEQRGTPATAMDLITATRPRLSGWSTALSMPLLAKPNRASPRARPRPIAGRGLVGAHPGAAPSVS